MICVRHWRDLNVKFVKVTFQKNYQLIKNSHTF
jgi:hypothetical protein